MKTIETRPGVTLAYEDDWFGPPWLNGEPIILVHGMGESSRAWTGWVPHLAGRWRVIRPDLPGFGASPVPMDYDWSPKALAAELARFMDRLGLVQAHVIAAKFGGAVAMQFAADFPERVTSLGIFSSPASTRRGASVADGGGIRMREVGVAQWAAETMRSRLGAEASEAQMRWWAEELMGKVDLTPALGVDKAMNELAVENELHRVRAPTLVVTTTASGLQSVEAVRRYQEKILGSHLLVMEGDCYHVAAVRPDECAGIAAAFIASLQ